MVEGDAEYRYSAAWIDCLATGATLGRSILSRGDHAVARRPAEEAATRPAALRARRVLSAPPWAPNGLLNRLSVRAFNEFWYRVTPRCTGHVESIASFFHPLDGVRGWNRLYGSRGFLQYQYVVPDDAHDAVRTSIEMLSDAQCGVVPRGAQALRAGQSRAAVVPRAGLDARARHPGDRAAAWPSCSTGSTELVADVGGRIYLAKDSRLRPELLPVMYPDLDRFAELRARVDPAGVLQSDLARRLGLP